MTLRYQSLIKVEPSQRRSIERSNSGEMCARNVILFRKLQQSGKSLVSLVAGNIAAGPSFPVHNVTSLCADQI
jgi:hypothetical protein